MEYIAGILAIIHEHGGKNVKPRQRVLGQLWENRCVIAQSPEVATQILSRWWQHNTHGTRLSSASFALQAFAKEHLTKYPLKWGL